MSEANVQHLQLISVVLGAQEGLLQVQGAVKSLSHEATEIQQQLHNSKRHNQLTHPHALNGHLFV